ncbi:TetR/AcrR family transcriptional regulator [Bradyrhizobium campsiandrae]|nr:TetR/AcrR family transcriptional regulator [Bradyrhizobium campsiandrae]
MKQTRSGKRLDLKRLDLKRLGWMKDQQSNSLDKRVERSRTKVLAETYRQLMRNGIAGVSIDAISRQSGVSKTTIYRHWPSRSALLLHACAQFGGPAPIPDTGSLRGDLRTLLDGLAAQLADEMWGSVYPSILDAAERDPEIAALQSRMHRTFMAPFEQVLDRGRERGEPSVQGRGTGILVAELVGPLFFRRWFSREKIDSAFLADVLDSALVRRAGMRPLPHAASRKRTGRKKS